MAAAIACLAASGEAAARDGKGATLHARLHRAAPVEDSRQLAAQVLAFAQSRIGRQVGDGECFALADQALQSAGARSAASFTPIWPDTDYVWGRAVALNDLRPGDILQFRDFQLQSRMTRNEILSGGGVDYAQTLQVDEREHHTAIVEHVDGGSVVLLEQNVDPQGRVVQRNRLRIAGGTETAQTPYGEITITTSVEGTLHAYRPIPMTQGQAALSPAG